MINQTTQVIKFASAKKSVPWLALIFFMLSAGLLAVIIFTVLGYQLLYFNRVYPGVSVMGVKVDGMTQPEIVKAVTGLTQGYLNRPIIIQTGTETRSFTGQQLGLWIDVESLAAQAYQVGRSGNLFLDMLTHLSLLSSSRNIELSLLYDNRSGQQPLQPLINAINYPPTDAQLVIRSAADVQIIPAKYGQELQVEATRPLIEATVLNKSSLPVVAIIRSIPPTIGDADLATIHQQVKRLLSKPMVFSYKAGEASAEWRLEPETMVKLVDVIQIIEPSGKPQFSLQIDQAGLTPYFEEFARAIHQEPVDAQLKFDEEAGELIVLRPSQDGHDVEVGAIYELVVQAVANGSNQVELPAVLTPPTIPSNDLESLGIKTLVSEATSYFKGSSQGRMQNIAVAASKFDGVIIPPGKIFSFNQHLGEVTKEEGYDVSLIIYGNRTVEGIGGGICQVSTTVFRSALFGGYEIVERWPHGYRVGWYEINSKVGLDATVYSPDVDFKFRNDTAHFLLIQTQADLEAGTVTFKFFGTPTGREVVIEEPEVTNLVKHDPPLYEKDPTLADGLTKQVDWAADGMDVKVTRIVREGDKIVYQDEFFSHYQPWRAVYKVGTRR
jgi:vancomycin resistance protein YoaR